MTNKGMLGNLGNLGNLMKQAQAMQERLAKVQAAVATNTGQAAARAARAVKERLACSRQCRNHAEGECCDICRDPARDATRVVVVEDVTTLLGFERTRG